MKAAISRPLHFNALALASAVISLSVLAAAQLPARAQDPAPNEQGASPATANQSKISAVVEFSIPALDRALEERVPRRLATFNDRATQCWHRRIFRREVDIDCVYSGFVERTGPIALRADRGRLTAAVPVYGRIEGQGIGRFARLLHGAGEGQLTVYATARPRLRPDWSVALDMSEGFRWEEPPALRILGFTVNLSRYVEPRVREQLNRVEADAAASLRNLDLRGKAETAWRQAFTPVKIFDAPEIWLQMTPETAAFAGLHARGEVLDGALEISGTTATTVGTAPAANPPTALPPLGEEVTEPGRFAVVLPVDIDYDAVRARVQEIASATRGTAGALRDIQIKSSGGQIVIGLRLAGADAADKDGEWTYLTATPRVDPASGMIAFPDIGVSTSSQHSAQASATTASNEDVVQGLRDRLRLAYQDALDKIVASANARLSRPLGNGFRSEAHLTSAGVAGIQVLTNGLRVDFRVNGDLKILYNL
jgi:hypothetical protein